MKGRRTKRQVARTRRLWFEPLEERSLLAVGLMPQSPEGEPPAAVATEQAGATAVNPACFASAEELQQFLIGRALEQYKGLFGQPVPQWWGWDGSMTYGLDLRAATVALATDSYSQTNVQVAGVDEADLVLIQAITSR